LKSVPQGRSKSEERVFALWVSGGTSVRPYRSSRFGGFNPSFETAAVLKEIKAARGVEILPPIPCEDRQEY
jgi:hypothetical protein